MTINDVITETKLTFSRSNKIIIKLELQAKAAMKIYCTSE